MTFLIRGAMVLVALAAAALSFQSLMHLGELCGYGRLAWLYPVVVDLGAGVSCVEWLHNRKRQALWMCWAFIVVSVVLNGTIHYLTSTGTPPGWLLVVLVAAVPPATFGLVVHLGWSTPTATVADHVSTLPIGNVTERPETSPPATGEFPHLTERTDDDLLAAVQHMADRDGKRPSRNIVARELGVGATRATRLLQQFDQTGPRRTA